MTNETAKNANRKQSPTDDLGASQLQDRFDKEAEQGYRGVVADPTPNHAYTAAGVTSGEPTPETDAGAAEAARAHAAKIEGQIADVAKKETD